MSGTRLRPCQPRRGAAVLLVALGLLASAAWPVLATDLPVCALQFAAPPRLVIDASAIGAYTVAVGDFNADGVLDVAAGSYSDSTIAWHRNAGGGTFDSPRNVVSDSAAGVTSIAAGDLDSDGTLDVVAVLWNAESVLWFANDGAGTFGPSSVRVIATALPGLIWVSLDDVNLDGALDVITASAADDSLVWYASDLAGAFAPGVTVTTAADYIGAHVTADIDGDGAPDLVSVSYNDDTVAWYRNSGLGGFTDGQRVIDSTALGAFGVSAADFDRDGRVDVLAGLYDASTVGWYRNTASAEPPFAVFAPIAAISTTVSGVWAVLAADLNGDSAPDVLAAASSDNSVVFFRNDGYGTFRTGKHVLTASASAAIALAVGDLNGDGAPDVVSAANGDATISWHPFASSVTFAATPVVSAPINSGRHVFATDVDSDGAVDLISASIGDNAFAWHRNDGLGSVVAGKQVISTSANGPSCVVGADFNSDGTVDVALSAYDGLIVWYRGGGSAQVGFTLGSIIASDATGVQSLAAADLDGDERADIVAALTIADRVVWFRNNHSGGATVPFDTVARVIADGADGAISVFVADLDRDGTPDVLAALTFASMFVWYRNDGTGGAAPWAPTVIYAPANRANCIVAADLDMDGALDVLGTAHDDNLVGWFRNDGLGGFGSGLRVISNTAAGATAVTTGDLDLDGDPDVFSCSYRDNTLAWYRNNGSGGFPDGKKLVSSSANGPFAITLTDMNNDGVLDLVAALAIDNVLAWWAGAVEPAWMPPPSDSPIYAAAPLPLVCAGLPNTFACQAARVVDAASLCNPALVVLPSTVRGCASQPSSVRTTAAARVLVRGADPVGTGTGAVGGSEIVCTFPGSQSLFAVGPGAALELDSLVVTVAASAASSVPTPSMFALCPDSGCTAEQGASLVMRNVTVTGFANAPASQSLVRDFQRGHGVVLVHARSTLSLAACTLVDARTGSIGAAVSVFGSGATLSLSAVRFARNTALGSASSTLGFGGGGAVALLGTDVTVTMTDCVFDANAASSDSGGAVLVRGARTVLTLTRVSLTANSAALGGGALAFVGAKGSLALLHSCELQRNTAGYGGAIAALSSELESVGALDSRLMSQMPSGGTAAGAVVTLDAQSRVGESAAAYGGAFFVCAAVVNASAATLAGPLTATLAGSVAFRCNEAVARAGSAPLLGPTSAWLALPAVLPTPLVAPSYGPLVATPPRTAIWLVPPPTEAQSGVSLGSGSAALVDAYGQRVSVSDLVVRVSATSAVHTALVVGTTALLVPTGGTGLYSLALFSVSARYWPASLENGQLVLAFVLAIDGATAVDSPSLSFALTLTNCVAGWGRVSLNASSVPLVCAECTGGTFSSAERAAAALPCEVCPLNTIQLATNTLNVSNSPKCVCKANTYSPAGKANEPCLQCPTGGFCAGGEAAPVAAPGYHPIDGTFVACPLASACLGNGLCATGYTGRLCGSCSSNYYTLSSKCLKCRRAQTGLVAFALALLAVCVTALMLWFNAVSSPTVRARFVSVLIGLAALQVVALFGKLSIDWGSLVIGFFSVASTLSLNIQLASPECSLAQSIDGWTLKWMLMLVLPVIAAVVVAALALLVVWPMRAAGMRQLAQLTRTGLVDASLRTWNQLLVLMHLPMTAAAMSPFGCRRDESGKAIFVDDPSRVCYDARWWRLFAPALVTSLLYGIGLPGAIGYALVRAHRKFDRAVFLRKFRFLVGRYSDACYAAEVALMGGKVSLVVVVTFFDADESKVGAGALVLSAIMVATARAMPFRLGVHNRLALWCLGSIEAILLAGMLQATLFRRVLAAVASAALIAGIFAGNIADFMSFRKHTLALAKVGPSSPDDALGDTAPLRGTLTSSADAAIGLWVLPGSGAVIELDEPSADDWVTDPEN